MAKVKISQHVALMIETVRANGISDSDLIDCIKKGDISPLQHAGEGHFDFTELLDFAREYKDEWEQAILQGYEIKYNTFRGIQFLLKVKFKQRAEQDYDVKDGYLDRVKLKEEDVVQLRSTLSKYWTIAEQGYEPETGLKTVRIELSRPV